MDRDAISFGPYRLFVAQRLLLEGDRPVRLGSRAFNILAALVERAGEVVGKEQLIAQAWPQTFVEESNLRIQVNALRRALGDGQGGQRYIINVPGQGYSFVAPVSLDESRASLSAKVVSAQAHNLPVAVTRIIGRGEIVETLHALRPDRTTLVIAHRAEALRHCDLVVELHNGRVVGSSKSGRIARVKTQATSAS